jgi:hypothetical protein
MLQRHTSRGGTFLLLLGLLLLLGGCAGPLPKTLPLDPGAQQEAAVLWSNFLAQRHPPGLDADIRLHWDVLGSKGAIAATVQLQQPALLRFAANDPLGRPLLLAVSDGKAFTMVDNRKGEAYRGTTDSKFWHSYVPETVAPHDLFVLLGGFVAQGEGSLATPSRDETQDGFWYAWLDARSIRHLVLLERASGTMRRHLLVDRKGNEVLALDYSDYRTEAKSGFVWPGRVRISGEAIAGTLAIQVEKVYSHDPQKAAVFRLTPPPHFTVEQVL